MKVIYEMPVKKYTSVRLSMFVKSRWLLIAIIVALTSVDARAQSVFKPQNCEFGVWFIAKPTIRKISMPTENGSLVKSIIADLEGILKDGLAHYFRSECTPFFNALALTPKNMIEDLNVLVKMNNLQDAKIWTEEDAKIGIVGRIRAKINTGTRVFFLDIRRYVSGNNLFDVWAGAERYPTIGIQMFFKSVNFRGEFIYPQK